jgi:hypothetical protein
MRQLQSCAIAILMGAGLSSCNENRDDRGYLEIKTEFAAVGSDVYLLNSAELSAMKGPNPIDLILQKPLGDFTLEVQRDGRVIKLCNATVTKNRIVTMDISILYDRLHCSVR